ncbi:MAG: endonuclease/exonuclease/phosphatase family protein [Bacteroidetes bacterium]|nr:endonuclease/exonuclease/phosphatase family protein [Bacteroidota bacterium]
MKRAYAFIILINLIYAVTAQSQDHTTMTIMSYNIRLDVAIDGENRWDNRKELFAGLIRFHNPIIVGLQEAQRHQLNYLVQALPEYQWIGIGREDGKDAGEIMAILYRKDAVELLRTSTFWCSPTPSSPGLGWDAACNRIVTWGKFRNVKNRQEFYLFNTHLDHLGVIARKESAHLLKDSIDAITENLPVVVTGDFNSHPADDPYHIITGTTSKRKLRDTFTISRQPHYGPKGTFNGFKLSEYKEQPIDYIFVSEGTAVLSHGTLTDSFHGRLPSDHFPVITTIVFDITD